LTSVVLNHSPFETAVHEELRAALVSATKYRLIINL